MGDVGATPPAYRFPPPTLPRDYDVPSDGVRTLAALAAAAPNGTLAAAFLHVQRGGPPAGSARRHGKRPRRKTLFTDTLPQVWDAGVTPYGRYARPTSASGKGKGNGNRKQKRDGNKRKRPRSAATSSSTSSGQPPSARSQSSEYSAYSAYSNHSANDASMVRSARRGGRHRASSARSANRGGRSPLPTDETPAPTLIRKRKKKTWSAAADPTLQAAATRRKRIVAEKKARARLFHETRGLRVNADGDAVDGAVPDLRHMSRKTQDEGADPELDAGNPQRHVLHRLARGPVEVLAEHHMQEDAQRKRELLGPTRESASLPRYHPEDATSSSSSSGGGGGGGGGGGDGDAYLFGEEGEDSFSNAAPLMNGPASLRHLPEGRIPWRLMLSGRTLPSDLLWHDLAHTLPILELNLSNMNVGDDLILNVLACEDAPHLALRELRLRNCARLTDASLFALSKCTAIRVLDVSGCHRLTDDGFVNFARTHSLLRSVDISGCAHVTQLGLSALATGCRRLTTMIATGLDLDDIALRAFAKQSGVAFSAKLKHVDFSGSCARATDGSMMSVLKGLGEARYVSVSGAPHVTDVSMAPLSRSVFRSLRALDVSELNVGDAGLSWMASGCMHGIRELNLGGCAAITDAGIGQISDKCTNLTCLSLAGCINITDGAIESLAAALGAAGLVNPYRHYKIKPPKRNLVVRRASVGKLPGQRGSQLASPREVAAAEHASEKEDEAREESYACVPSGLRVLDVSDCGQLTDRALRSLGEHCDTLTTLVLVGVNNITDVGLTHLANIGWRIRARKAEQRRKEAIALQTKYGGAENFPPHVQQEQLRKDNAAPYQPLSSLNFAGRFRVSNVGLNTHFGVARLTDAGVSRMLLGNECKCTGLTSLNFTGLAYVGDLTMRAIAKACGSTLTALALSGCGRISDAGVRALCGFFGLRRGQQGCTALSDLNLAGCQRIGDGALEALGSSPVSKTLTRLNLFKCRGITDRGVRHFRTCVALQYVNLRTCVNVTDGGLVAWGQPCDSSVESVHEQTEEDGAPKTAAPRPFAKDPVLTHLNVAGLPEISMHGIVALAAKFTRLCRLDAGGCENITRAELAALVSTNDKSGNNGGSSQITPVTTHVLLPGARISPNPKFVALVPAAPVSGLRLIHAYVEKTSHQHLAAERIQRRWRYRTSMQRKLREALEERKRKRRMRKKASVVLQRTVFRGEAGRRKAARRRQQLRLEDSMRRKMQRVARGHLGRQRMRRRKQYLAYIAAKKWTNATIIQKVLYRGRRGRTAAMEKRAAYTRAALTLQGWMRVQWAMMEHERLLRAHRQLVRKRNTAARKVQAWVQGVKEKRGVMAAYWRLQSSTLRIQTWVRQWQSQRRVAVWRQELTNACIVVQRCYRMSEARFMRFMLRRARKEHEEYTHACALRIQTQLARPWLARRRVDLELRRERAATLFQAAWQYFKAKCSKRVLRLVARQEERERKIIEAKARAMAAQWRIEEDLKPDSLASRQRAMLETGAAVRIQKMWVRSKILRRIRAIMGWKKNLSAVRIQACMRGCWARRYVRWKRRVWDAVTYRIARWWRAFAVRYAYRDAKKLREALRRADMLDKKRQLMVKARARRMEALLERTRQRAATLLQMEWKAYLIRKATAARLKLIQDAKEKELRELEAYRAQLQAEQKERHTLKGKLKRWKKFLTDPAAMKKRFVPDKREIQEKMDQVRAKWDSKTRERLLRGEFESLMYSIQARQKEQIAQTGVVDVALTVGETDYRAFRAEQHLKEKEGLPFFVTNRVDLHASHFEVSEGQKVPRPRWIFLWTQTAHNRTSHILTDFEIRRRPKGLNELKYRTYLDEIEAAGWTVKWSRKCRFEIRYRRDGKHMIRALQAEAIRNRQARLLKTGWATLHMPPGEHEAEIVRAMKKSAAKAGRPYIKPPSDGGSGDGETKTSSRAVSKEVRFAIEEYAEISASIDPQCVDVGMYGYDTGTKMFVKHALPKKSDRAMEAHFEALKQSDGTYADVSQSSMGDDGLETLLEQVEFAGYSAVDIDKLRMKFNAMDDDASGTVDIDEFFAYIKERRTVLSEHMFEFHDIEFGEHLEEELLDFGHFVKAITTLCLFDGTLLVRFFFNIFDKANKRYILKTEARQLLEMLQHQEPGVCTKGQRDRAALMLGIIGSGQGQGVVTFEDFLTLSERCPTVVYPLFKLQHTLRKTFLGVKFWEKKLTKMAKARELVFAARHDGAELIQGDVTGNLLNLSEKKDHEKRKKKRAARTQKWAKSQPKR